MPELPDNWQQVVATALQRPLTAANLLDWRLCPHKFLLSFFAPSRQQRALGALRALHSAVRQTLVECDKRGGPAAVPLEWLRDEFMRLFDGSACADSLEEEQMRKLGLRMLAEFHASQRESPCRLLGADVRFEANIDDFAFVAVADRHEDCPELGAVVARYDVHKDPPGPTRILRDLRMGLLVVLAEQCLGSRPVARLYALRRGRIYDVQFDDAAAGRVRQQALALARAIRADTAFEPRPGDHCLWCRVRHACQAWQQRRQLVREG